MSRDLGQQTAARLAHEWSAPWAAGHLQPEHLQALAKRFEGLEPLAKARTMLAGTFMRPEALAACRDELRSLAEQAVGDDDEWVRVIGRAVGDFSGSLDLEAVVSESRLVSGTMAELKRLLDEHAPCPEFRPLEELYLSPRAAAARGGGAQPRQHAHFLLRKAPNAASSQAIAAAALPTVPQDLSINSGSQAGYSEKLSSREATVPASAAAAAAADAGPFQQAAVPAFERLPASIAPPLHSPRAAPKAAPAADMFLSSKPIQRPAAADRRGVGMGRKVRTKQIDIKEAEEAAAKRAAAEKATAQEASRREANGAQPCEAEAEQIGGEAGVSSGAGRSGQSQMPSLSDYLGGGSAQPKQPQRPAADAGSSERQQRQRHNEYEQVTEAAAGGGGQHYDQQYDQHRQQHWNGGTGGWQQQQQQQRHEEPGGWPGHDQPEHWRHQDPQQDPQHECHGWDHQQEPQGWVDHDAGGGRDDRVNHDAAGNRDGWVDHDAAGGRDAWRDHDAMGGRDSWQSRSGGGSADAATHYSGGAAGRQGVRGGGQQQRGADSEPESGEVEAEEGELEASPAKRPRVDDGGWD